ncbi:hypothetical protein KDA00_02950 [Candidatus Saccharibacteria bacterium]|nr:hypothetical protein [Candidatus Saccharibacteria bacterium]
MFSRVKNRRLEYALVALVITLVPLFSLFSKVNAAELTNRSVTISTSEVDALSNYTFRFRINTAITVGSLEMEFCTNSPFIGDACTAPVGFSLASSSMGSQSGLTGFSIHPSTAGSRLVLGRIPAGVLPPTTSVITVNNITNPSVLDSVFVRISTFATNDATGIRGDTGTVVYSLANQLDTSGYVPPYLTFCTGNSVAPDCSSSIGNYLTFGELSTSFTKSVTSQFAVATNDPTGYVTNILGVTLTSGNNTIPANTVPTISIPGTSQFGINLRANSSPLVGADKIGIGTGNPEPEFNASNSYTFKNGLIARSTLPTEFNTFTVTYIANISPAQNPGVYSSTITYVTTVSF